MQPEQIDSSQNSTEAKTEFLERATEPKDLVSVVIPCRNDESTIAAAVESVTRQDWQSVEIILCDDGSTDGTVSAAQAAVERASNTRMIVLSTGGRGAAGARNAGIHAAQGSVIAFLDSDDVWFPEKLSTCMRHIEAGADVVMHAEEWRNDRGGVRVVKYSNLIDHSVPLPLSVYRTNPFSTSAVVVRCAILDRSGVFDETIPSAEDYDLWLRITLVPGVTAHFIDDVLGVYSVRSGSESSRIAARHDAMMQIGRRYREAIASINRASRLEGLRFNSRVRLATGIRFLRAGNYVRGGLLVTVGLLQWPVRPEIIWWFRARRRAASSVRQRTNA
jgi:glycosyltransferase involved in cell wall biosynthesis